MNALTDFAFDERHGSLLVSGERAIDLDELRRGLATQSTPAVFRDALERARLTFRLDRRPDSDGPLLGWVGAELALLWVGNGLGHGNLFVAPTVEWPGMVARAIDLGPRPEIELEPILVESAEMLGTSAQGPPALFDEPATIWTLRLGHEDGGSDETREVIVDSASGYFRPEQPASACTLVALTPCRPRQIWALLAGLLEEAAR